MKPYKPTGSLKSFIDAGKVKTRVLGAVERHVLSLPQGDDRRTDVLHPSDMVDAAWCHRASYFHITGRVPATRDFSFRLMSTFQTGHDIHDKWQNWFKDMGNLYGRWKCKVCNKVVWALASDLEKIEPECGPWKYKEVGLDYSPLHIAGHSDGLLVGFGDPLMLEIKSIGSGTLRWEFAEQYAENNYSLDKTWKQIDSPSIKHVNQVQIYMKLAELLDLEYKPQEAVLIYELKDSQESKEFVVSKSDFGIKHLFDAAEMIAQAVKDKVAPPCNISSEGCKRCKGYTDESN